MLSPLAYILGMILCYVVGVVVGVVIQRMETSK